MGAGIRRIGRLASGVLRAIFGLPGRAMHAVRWLILLGAIGASFWDDAREFVAAHPWQTVAVAFAYGAILYAYDLQTRLEEIQRVKIMEVSGRAEFYRDVAHWRPDIERVPNLLHVWTFYALRNHGDSAMHPPPELRLLGGRGVLPDVERLDLPRLIPRRGPPIAARFGREAEIPPRTTTEWECQYTLQLPSAQVVEQPLRVELTFVVVGQPSERKVIPLEVRDESKPPAGPPSPTAVEPCQPSLPGSS